MASGPLTENHGPPSCLTRQAGGLLLAICLAACEPVRQPEPDARNDTVSAVLRLEERLRQAMAASDTATLGALWAPEYLSTSAVGHTSNRTESLAAYGAGLVRVDSANLRDVDVRTYGTTAVSLGFLDWAGTAAGQPFRSTVRFLHVWALSDDDTWRLVASQLTNQPATPPRR